MTEPDPARPAPEPGPATPTRLPEVAAMLLGTSQWVLTGLRNDMGRATTADADAVEARLARARYSGAMAVHDALVDALVWRGLTP